MFILHIAEGANNLAPTLLFPFVNCHCASKGWASKSDSLLLRSSFNPRWC